MKKYIDLVKGIFKEMPPIKSKIVLILICFGLTAGISFFQPLITRQVTDFGLVQKQFDVIVQFTLLLVLLVLVNQVIELIQTNLFVNFQNDVQYNLITRAARKLFKLEVSYFTDNNSAEVINKLGMDTSMMAMLVDRSIMFTISYILRMASGILGLFVISWQLALIVMAVIPIKFFTVKFLSKKREKLTEEMIALNGDFAAWFGDNINGVKEIKLWNLYKVKLNTLRKHQKNILDNNKRTVMLDAWNMIIEVILEWGVTCSLYIIGGYMVTRGEISVGDIFAFVAYSSYVTGPISAIMNLKFILSRIMPSAKRLSEFYKLNEELTGDTEIKNFSDLSIENISFSYGDRKVLDELSLKIKSKDKIAIIGENGSGKTTLINTILRFENFKSGKININGKSVDDVDLQSYRDLFAVVNQTPYIFKGSLKGNIDLLNGKSEKELSYAVTTSGVDGFTQSLDDETGVQGTKLSGGERQKLAIARAIVKDSPIIILDEATANLDVDSHKLVNRVVHNEFKDKTVIMITHSYEDLEGFDSVYELTNGKLVKTSV